MHKDSFRENVKCAWAIDKAVRDCVREGEAALAEDCIQPILEAYGFKRVCFVLSNTLNEMAQPRLVSEEVRKWSQLPWVPPDGKRNRQFAVEASAPQLEALIRQTRTAYQALGLFGPEHCAGDPSKLDYEGKVLVLSPGALRESHWSPRDQPSTLSAWEMGRSCAGTDMISTVCWTINICPTGRQRRWRRFRIPSSNSRRLPPAEWR